MLNAIKSEFVPAPHCPWILQLGEVVTKRSSVAIFDFFDTATISILGADSIVSFDEESYKFPLQPLIWSVRSNTLLIFPKDSLIFPLLR
jgi:hypothetical protein